MAEIGPKSLIDYTDDELRAGIRRSASTAWTYQEMLSELDRRASRRAARASFALGLVSLLIALSAIIVTAIRA
ncbi:MAG: hypothetical protein ACXWPO_07570 [Candidatus Limnocylindrales bacterium]